MGGSTTEISQPANLYVLVYDNLILRMCLCDFDMFDSFLLKEGTTKLVVLLEHLLEPARAQ